LAQAAVMRAPMPGWSKASRKYAGRASCDPAAVICAATASLHPGESCVSACRINSHSPPAASTPRPIWPPREAAPVMTMAPISAAMRDVASLDPPSLTISSRINPAFTPSISEAAHPGRAVSAFSVGMMIESGARMGFVGGPK
tara:strand:+ start:26303 stop:26731 length:429 start_codon:yes stop_codon:yes gene_type:complete